MIWQEIEEEQNQFFLPLLHSSEEFIQASQSFLWRGVQKEISKKQMFFLLLIVEQVFFSLLLLLLWSFCANGDWVTSLDILQLDLKYLERNYWSFE